MVLTTLALLSCLQVGKSLSDTAIRKVQLAPHVGQVQWTSASEILEFNYGPPISVEREDLGTGTKSSVVFGPEFDSSEMALAPDGKHLLFRLARPEGHDDIVHFVVVTAIDGAQRTRPVRLTHINSVVLWNDASSWVEVPAHSGPGSVKVFVHDIRSDKERTAVWGPFPVSTNVATIGSLTSKKTYLYSVDWRGLGVTAKELVIYETGAGARLKAAVAHHVPLPPNSHIWANNDDALIRFSPDGRRLFAVLKQYTFDIRNHPRFDEAARAEMKRDQASPYVLWVANIDGSAGRVIGTQPHPMGPRDDPYVHALYDPQWTPDGKGMSFTQDGWLYQIPIPE